MKRIETMFAFVQQETNGNEDVAGFSRKGNPWLLPLVGSDETRLDTLRRVAQEIATTTGRPVRLLRFSAREQLEIIEPQVEQQPWK